MGIIGGVQDRIAKGAIGGETKEFVKAKRLAFYVGLIAFLLAPVMVLNVWIFEACFRDSISHFYYSRFTGDVLVGALVFIAAFLFAYNGRFRAENTMSKLAGLGALGVAWFPVSDTGCEGSSGFAGRAFITVATDGTDPLAVSRIVTPLEGADAFQGMFQFLPFVDAIHFASAGLLLGTLMVFCVFIFTIADPSEKTADGDLLPGKKARNRLYYTCGIFMFGALIVIVLNSAKLISQEIWIGYNLMFWMEWVILFFFGICWMTKGRFEYVRDSWTGKIFANWFMDDVHPDMADKLKTA
ncbi:MAG: hypothetical protein AAGJ28_11185 [Pseudomonadota bacterium]